MVGSSDLMPSWFEKFAKISAEIWRQLLLGMKNPGKGLTLDHLQALVEHRNPFAKTQFADVQLDIIIDWQDFYRKTFGGFCDYSNVRIPEKPEGEWRLLIIEDLSLEQLYAKCKELFPCWRWTNDDLDKKVTWNERNAKDGVRAIWVKDVQEADENLKNLSADDIQEKGVKTETLAERLIHELKFFNETGNHLDIKNVTLCAGSRRSDGLVPRVVFDGDRMDVDWYRSDGASGGLRSREVVS
ncbi:MAG: hypothetical protein US25_C0006G0002 [Candidatus Moranbacteria bacterium GW2011_GWE1_36_7]|nr:MAG: hypothetical protein UR99_C0002G0023 [Candidatus Moranbacteria bacterium GW2011_GWD2_36_12]KKQ07048.1 MAG: hypothetical protein US16_C0003G0023 [Candidatus Moranbacteria bacterium GW2011_GWE2_36_40]KKQ15374.1 MAG: hypothetical protein US25_C0006G0002 [Candidatus Moranbacteria bacterium GW2011_GWE1_36_7]